MIAALQKDDAFLEDVHASRNEEGLRTWWLGQSGFLVQWQGHHLLFDPYLSDSLTIKYADTEKPHVRMTERVIAPERLDFIDVVTSTHNHTDHLDGETLIPLMEANPDMMIVLPEANRVFASDRLQCDPSGFTGMDDGTGSTAGPFRFHAVPAAHENIDRDDAGRCHFLGFVVQFGPFTVYHSGDTIRYEGMAERLSQWEIDLAFLPINGSRPERKVPGNLWGREAAQLAKEVDIRTVIPCHFEMFEFNTVTPNEFVEACEELGQSFVLMKSGEKARLNK